ncbi:MAG: universal stress protein [Amphritea sp.]
MLFNKQLMVVIDQHDTEYLSLHRAQVIAQRLKCAISVLWLGDSELQPAQLVEQLQGEGLVASYQLCPEDSLLPVLKKLWQEAHFGLLIKTCDPRKRSFFTSRDNQILRELPCPVLLVKHDNRWENGIVLGAVNPFNDASYQQQLNCGVLTLANEIALLVHGALHIAVASPSVMMGADSVMQSEELIQQSARQAMQALLQQLEIPVSGIAVGEGPVEYWVPHVANELNASVVVIGTRARGGVKGALIGNTAERILHRLNADVLVMRPGLSAELMPIIHDA